MKARLLLGGLVAVAIVAGPQPRAAQAEGLYAVRPIDGYGCAKLAITEREAMDPSGGIPIRIAPNANAPIGTLASSVLLLKKPLHVENGFAEVLQLNGQPGWIDQTRVAPFDPLARCVPSIMSNGRPGIG